MAAVLSWSDYVVIGIMLLVCLAIGIYYRFTGGRQKTIEEYFNANKSMSVISVAVALMVSFMSGISLLGGSAESYLHGTQFVAVNFSHVLGYPIILYGFFPVFDKLQVKSVYEYLEKRFGKGARLTTSFLNLIQLLLYSGVVLYAPCLALEATTGLSKNGMIIVTGLICAIYSSIGGIKAVLITDVFQGFLMFTSMFAIIGISAFNAGGLSEIWKIAEQGQRIEFDSISLDPTVRHTWWSLMIGGFFICLSLYGVNQVQIQRMLTVRDLKAARKALWISWPMLIGLSCLISFTGLAIFSKYKDCDPLKKGTIKSADQLMPLYVMDTMSGVPGLSGLFIAGVLSAGLSTISAGLNSLSVITLEDFIKPIYSQCSGTSLSAKTSIVFGKMLTVIYGLLCIGVAFLAQFLGGVLEASMTIFGLVGGPLVGIFTLGMATESATEIGAVSGVLTSLILLVWAGFGQPRPKPSSLPLSISGCGDGSFFNTTLPISSPKDASYFYLYRISYLWYSPIGFFITIFVGLSISYAMNYFGIQKKNTDIDTSLFFPIIQRRVISKRNKNGVDRESLPQKYVFSESQSNQMNDAVQNTMHL